MRRYVHANRFYRNMIIVMFLAVCLLSAFVLKLSRDLSALAADNNIVPENVILAQQAGVTSQPAGAATLQAETVAPGLTSTAGDGNVIGVVEKAADSVVEIVTEIRQTNQFARQFVTSGAGSGVILTENGYIVTNHHVIENASTITVRLTNGTEYTATLIGTDQKTDLAVIKIEASGLKAASFADSDTIRVGQVAVAIGNPLGELGGTVTEGIISARDRAITIDNQTMTLLQTSAAVNPGNSGGGLFDSSGSLIGVVNAKSSGSDIEGLAFAIPSNVVAEVAAQILENGYVTGRPQLGVRLVEINDPFTALRYRVSSTGFYVAESTASGFMAGDRIVSINGAFISSEADINSALDQCSVGDTATIVVVRDGQELALYITLTELIPQSQAA